MENDLVKRAAAVRGIPFIGLRTIGDTAADSLNPLILRFLDDSGQVRPAALAKTLLLHPGLLSHLRNLKQKSEIACARLSEATRLLVNSL